jgi:hypothetical protein
MFHRCVGMPSRPCSVKLGQLQTSVATSKSLASRSAPAITSRRIVPLPSSCTRGRPSSCLSLAEQVHPLPDALNSIPPTVDVEALAVKRRVAAGQVYVDVGFWGGAVPGNVPDLRALHDAGVFGFKCFLLHSGVDEFPPLDPDGLELALKEIASLAR